MLAMYNGQNHAENDEVQLWKNRGLGPLGPSILDPFYVIYAFGFVTVSFIGSCLNAMELVVRN